MQRRTASSESPRRQAAARVRPATTAQPAGFELPGQQAAGQSIDRSPRMAAQRRQLQRTFGTGAGVPPVQAKMGFELETDNKADKWNGAKWVPYGRSKGKPIYKGAGFDVETDTHDNPEFIFAPQDDRARITAAAAAAAEFCLAMNTEHNRRKGEYKDNRKADSFKNLGGGWQGDYRLRISDESWAADGQATLGVKLQDIPKYMNHVLAREQVTELGKMMHKVRDGARSAQVQGLLALMIQFVADFQEWEGKDNDEGPKNAQAYMNRNSFDKMLNAMAAERVAEFRALFYDGKDWKDDNPITTATGVDGADRVIPNGYLGLVEVGKKKKTTRMQTIQNQTTLKDWIDSVLGAASAAEYEPDLMSPPEGWRGGNYGMGLMDMDTESVEGTPLALFEYRHTDNREDLGELTGKNIPAPEWGTWMEERFDKAQAWNDTLRAPPAELEEAAGGGEAQDEGVVEEGGEA